MQNNVLINFDSVSFSYSKDNKIIDNASFSINNGGFIGVIGPNGGGKTTLFKLILGLLKPETGKITVLDKSPNKAVQFIGYVPQEKDINKGFPITVYDLVLMGRLCKKKFIKKYTEEDKNIASESLKLVNMIDYKNTQINELSGGQKQRVYIARALTSKPIILLLDEPTTGIDPKFHHEFYNLIKEINKSITVIIITHDLHCLSSEATSIIYVNRDVIVKRKEDITEKSFYEFYHTL